MPYTKQGIKFLSNEINCIHNILTTINYGLLLSIFLTMLAPTLYSTFRIYFISDIPDEWGFNIASQIAWLNVIYSVSKACLIFPLYYILGAVVTNSELYYKRVKQVIMVVIPIYTFISLIIWGFTENLVLFLSQKTELVDITVQYIRLESIAMPFIVILDILTIALITMGSNKRIYNFIILQLVIRFVCDFMFISNDILNADVLGVAYSSIAISGLSVAIGMIFLFYKPIKHSKNNLSVLNISTKKWLKVSAIAGLESTVRNFTFLYMILKLVNEAEKSGVLWVANAFIWGWLLLPIMAISELMKRDAGTNNGFIGERFKGYLYLTAICIVIWIITIPLWGWFIQNIMGVDDYMPVLKLVLFFVAFYVSFAFNNILDSYLYGIGRTDLMLYQTLFVNMVYYLGAFIFYKQGLFIPTLESISWLFGGGLILDFIATITIFKLFKLPRTKMKKGG